MPLEKALVGFGTCPYNRELTEETFDFSKAVYLRCNDLRRSGSSALDLCYVAASRLGLFYELSLFPWDYAAAAVIVSEAEESFPPPKGPPFSLQKKSPILANTRSSDRKKLTKNFWRCEKNFFRTDRKKAEAIASGFFKGSRTYFFDTGSVHPAASSKLFGQSAPLHRKIIRHLLAGKGDQELPFLLPYASKER